MRGLIQILLNKIDDNKIKVYLITTSNWEAKVIPFQSSYKDLINNILIPLENRNLDREALNNKGKELYQMIFGEQKLKNFLEEYQFDLQHKLLFQLRIPKSDSLLQAFPWELLYKDRFLFEGNSDVLVRHIDFRGKILPINKQHKLHILLINHRPEIPEGYGKLDDTEYNNIKQLEVDNPDKIKVNIIKDIPNQNTMACISDSVDNNINIVHIDTHGDFGWLCRNNKCREIINKPGEENCKKCKSPRYGREEKGYLLFRDQDGKASWHSGDEIVKNLRENNIMLVALSACRTAKLTDNISSFSSIAGSLVREGIPYVIGMQYNIKADDAQKFFRKFYQELIESKSIIDAFDKAKLAIPDSWYCPVLYVRDNFSNYDDRILRDDKALKIQEWRGIYDRTMHLLEELEKIRKNQPLLRSIKKCQNGSNECFEIIKENIITDIQELDRETKRFIDYINNINNQKIIIVTKSPLNDYERRFDVLKISVSNPNEKIEIFTTHINGIKEIYKRLLLLSDNNIKMLINAL